jgi:DNA invertase Pin-like site-specific DNA recombinase
MQPLRFVSWAAVSSEEQAKKVSLSDQRRLNQEHIHKWNGVLVADLVVPGISRYIVLFEDAMRRIEAYAHLKELIDRKAFDVLICYDFTRLGRRDSLISAVVGLCEDAGIRLYETTSPPTTLDGPIGTFDTRLLNAFKGVMSHNEIDKLVRRADSGRRARVKRGKHAGNPPYGYKRVFDDQGKSCAVVNEDEAVVVRLFYELYLERGRSLASICKEFNARGYVSPQSKRPWVPGTIRQLIINCWTYAGYATWGTYSKKGEMFRSKAEWEPIISEDMARKAERERQARAYGRRAVSGANRLSLVAKCDYCGANICIHQKAGHNGYVKNTYLCKNKCRGSRIFEPDMLSAIEAAIVELQNNARLENLIGDTPSSHDNLIETYQEMNRALEQVRSQRKELTMVFTREPSA